MSESLRFETWDVFTDMRFTGNQLAVVFDADVLTGETMQAITREFGYSETVFVLEGQQAGCDARLRIFTPGGELPFAGHPTVGAAAAIARRHDLQGGLELQLDAGRFPVRVTGSGEVRHAEFENPNLPRVVAEGPDTGLVETALGLPRGSVAGGPERPRRCGAGIDFVYAAAPLEAVNNASLNTAAWAALALGDACGVLLYAPAAQESPADWHVRMFGPHIGVAEDPATGSAAAGLPAQLRAAGELVDGSFDWRVEQGVEMGRPATIRVRFDLRQSTFASLHVGGQAVLVSSGEIRYRR
ncbi:MAG: PhzF family phenazine biosynthesis protein [Wenzhouxiangellaceae bacterium]|nr:PhzF family phenazine biosynthesis protein [Wenzhouxiangellaceae bacterium]MBS3745966.1 PhzF family phenazine biosynthesis protein [Wenzhouxiangellaceae bacterium]